VLLQLSLERLRLLQLQDLAHHLRDLHILRFSLSSQLFILLSQALQLLAHISTVASSALPLLARLLIGSIVLSLSAIDWKSGVGVHAAEMLVEVFLS
jgi:hypothetical protein